MSTLASLPDPDHQGASKFGSSFIKARWECPFKHWAMFWAPHPRSGGQGLVPPILGKALAVGQFTHVGLAEYCLTGANLDPAIAAINKAIENYQGPIIEDVEQVQEDSVALLTQYHEFWAGDHPELIYYEWEPIVERDLVLEVGYKDYQYTARLDAVVQHQGFTYIFEHKTVDTSRYSSLIAAAAMDIQITGQLFLVTHLLPDLKVTAVLLNSLIKRRAKSKDPCSREAIYRSDLALEKFRLDITRTLESIDQDANKFQELSSAGMDPWEAARQVYPQHGGEQCHRYGPCPYLDLCINPGRETPYAATFLPRASNGGTLRPEKEKEETND